MSTLKNMQTEIAEHCNADQYLVQGGCRAFAEEQQDIVQQIDIQLQAGGLVIVVSTPTAKVLGRVPNGIEVELPDFAIRTTESPALTRETPETITALQAAQHIAIMFDRPKFRLLTIVQTADDKTGTVSVTAFFKTTTIIADPAPTAGTAQTQE